MTALPVMSEAKRRAEALRGLAALYAAAPTAEWLARLVPLARAASDDDPVAEILAALRDETDLEAAAERLSIEHTRLFGGLQEGYGPPPPYESLWREGRLMGETTEAVARAYLAAGYRPSQEWSPFDHLVEELLFLASLANGEHAFAESGRDDEARWARERRHEFLDRHLLTWVPSYAETIAAEAREPFHRSLARVTALVLTEDARRAP